MDITRDKISQIMPISETLRNSISIEEREAIKAFQRGNAAGFDGFSTEFYMSALKENVL